MACGCDRGTLVCSCFFTSFILGLFVLVPVLVTLFASPSSPSFSINLFHNQAFNITRRGDNLTIHFDFKLKNQNSAIGLHYPDPLKITFSYFPNVSMMVFLAEYKIDGFYQGNGKGRRIRDEVESNSLPTELEGTDVIAFRVDVAGTYKYKKAGMKREKIDLGCLAVVNITTSQKLQMGFIRMVSPGLDSKLEPPPKDDAGI